MSAGTVRDNGLLCASFLVARCLMLDVPIWSELAFLENQEKFGQSWQQHVRVDCNAAVRKTRLRSSCELGYGVWVHFFESVLGVTSTRLR